MSARTLQRWPWIVGLAAALTAIFYIRIGAVGNQHANGGGTTEEFGEKSTFAFNAVKQLDGSVNGHLTYHFRAADVTFHMKNDCLYVMPGTKTAVIAGTVTMVTGTALPFIVPGARGLFSVKDNGQGKDAVDLVSDVIISPPGVTVICEVTPPTPTLEIDGNVTVKE